MTAPFRTRERLEAAIGSRFTITRELGGGGMSDTFVARDLLLGRDIVIKALAPQIANDVSLERFSREIQFSASLQHPNLVPVLDTGVADGLPYFTMPYVAGESLRRRLDGTPMPISDTVSILRDVARGLGAAHAHGVVHRDIKPDNVLLTGDAALVTDLGIAKAVYASGNADRITKTGLAIGTPAYFAPEQATGDTVDVRADWYAFGAMAFEMLTGSLPFDAPTDAGLLVAHVTEPPPDIRNVRADLPEPLAALVMACLAKDPAQRPASSAEVIASLAASERGGTMDARVLTPRAPGTTTPVAASTTAPTAASARPDAPRRRKIAGAVVMVVALVSIAVWRPWSRPTSDIAAPLVGPRTVWLASSATSDSGITAAVRRTLRDRIPRAAAVALAPYDTVFADSTAAAGFARTQRSVVIWLTTTPTTASATILPPVGDATCPVFADVADGSSADVRRADLVERVLGTLAVRYDALLVQRYMRGARLSSTEAMCATYRLDALQRLAAFRADSLRPMARRLADLDTALLLDPNFIEAQADRAAATGDTATLRAVQTQRSGAAVDRLELSIQEALETNPLQALELAERGAETGQVARLTLARARMNAGRPQRALEVLNALTPAERTATDDQDLIDAVRAQSLYLLGDDAAALRAAAEAPNAGLRALMRLPSLAALGDSAGWRAALAATTLSPDERFRQVLRSAGIATASGHAAWGARLYEQALAMGETELSGTTATADLGLLVAECRRRTGAADGAVQLLRELRARLRGDSLADARISGLQALIALERGDVTGARAAIARVEQLDASLRHWQIALLRARLAVAQRQLPAAVTLVRRANAIGMPRERLGPALMSADLRADPDLAPLLATAAGRAVLLAQEP